MLLLVLGLAAGKARKGKKFAVLVGICNYSSPTLKTLNYSIRDMEDLAEVLRQGGYEITLLTSASQDPSLRATFFNIQARTAEVLARCQPQDLVLVALGGHGIQYRGGQAYFCPQDAFPEKNTGSLLGMSELYKQMELSKAGTKLLLVDACRSDPNARDDKAIQGLRGQSMPRPPRGVATLYSCSAGESAYECGKLERGVFFYFVVKGLQDKETRNSRGEVTWSALEKHVRHKVPAEGPKFLREGKKQTPVVASGGLAGDPVLLAFPKE